MPLYEFQCQECKALVEVLMKMSEPPPEACTSCHGSVLTKVISRSSYTHSGQGWYKKSYAAKAGRKARAKGTRESAPITIDDAHYHPESIPPAKRPV